MDRKEKDHRLRPCPWCGRQPVVKVMLCGSYPDMWKAYHVRCDSVNCSFAPIRFDEPHRGWRQEGREDAREFAVASWNEGDICIPLRVELPTQHWVVERSRGEKTHDRYSYRNGSMMVIVTTNHGIAATLLKKMPIIVTRTSYDRMFPERPKMDGEIWDSRENQRIFDNWYENIFKNRTDPVDVPPYRFFLVEGRQTIRVKLTSLRLATLANAVEMQFSIPDLSPQVGDYPWSRSRTDTAWKQRPAPVPPIYEYQAREYSLEGWTDIETTIEEGITYGVGYPPEPLKIVEPKSRSRPRSRRNPP